MVKKAMAAEKGKVLAAEKSSGTLAKIPLRAAREITIGPIEAEIRISEIRYSETQTRASIDMGRVGEYAQLMREGIEFPPIDVFQDACGYWLGGGVHRTLAMQETGREMITARLRDGGRVSAIMFGAGDNKHGMIMSRADRGRAIKMYLEAAAEGGLNPSSREVARHIGCDHHTVESVRQKVAEGEEKGLGKIPSWAPETRTDKRGVARTVAPAKPKAGKRGGIPEPLFAANQAVRVSRGEYRGQLGIVEGIDAAASKGDQHYYRVRFGGGEKLVFAEGELDRGVSVSSAPTPRHGLGITLRVIGGEGMPNYMCRHIGKTGKVTEIVPAENPGEMPGYVIQFLDEEDCEEFQEAHLEWVADGRVGTLSVAPKKKSEPPAAWNGTSFARRMAEAATADECRKVIGEIKAAVEYLMRANGDVPAMGQITPKFCMGWLPESVKALDKAVAAAYKGSPVRKLYAAELGALARCGKEAMAIWNERYAASDWMGYDIDLKSLDEARGVAVGVDLAPGESRTVGGVLPLSELEINEGVRKALELLAGESEALWGLKTATDDELLDLAGQMLGEGEGGMNGDAPNIEIMLYGGAAPYVAFHEIDSGDLILSVSDRELVRRMRAIWGIDPPEEAEFGDAVDRAADEGEHVCGQAFLVGAARFEGCLSRIRRELEIIGAIGLEEIHYSGVAGMLEDLMDEMMGLLDRVRLATDREE